jgi:hypothetical protein
VRYCVIQQGETPVAVVFHDHCDGSFYCRSRLNSFLSAFNAQTEKSEIRFSREGDVLRAVTAGPQDYGWIDFMLDHLCTGHWSRGPSGEIISTEANVDAVVRQIFA